MLSTWVFEKIMILVLSFSGGFLFYSLMNEALKRDKKQYMDMLLSVLMNLILSIWVAKILWQWPLLFKDPLAAIAYPSDSRAFYTGFIVTFILTWWAIRRGKWRFQALINVSIPTLLGASFVYEFLQIVWKNNTNMIIYFVFLLILLMIYIWNVKKNVFMKNLFIAFSWGIGLCLIFIFKPYANVFGYPLSPFFFVVLISLIGLSILFFRKKQYKS